MSANVSQRWLKDGVDIALTITAPNGMSTQQWERVGAVITEIERLIARLTLDEGEKSDVD